MLGPSRKGNDFHLRLAPWGPTGDSPTMGHRPSLGCEVSTVGQQCCPCPLITPSATKPGHSIAFSPQATSQNATTYMYIYTKTPKHEVYKNSRRGFPHTNSSRNPLKGGQEMGQETCAPPSPPTLPFPAQDGGSPDKGTLQGTAQTQARGEGGTELGASQSRPGPPTSMDTGDQWGGTRQDK